MPIRIATISDIPEMHKIRMAVRENMLSDPGKITTADYKNHIQHLGAGWVHADDEMNGFAIVNLVDHTVWALFVHPDKEGQGIGKMLHDTMLTWYFNQSSVPLSLTTEPGTRAERFYRSAGWTENGTKGSDEIRFIFYLPALNHHQ